MFCIKSDVITLGFIEMYGLVTVWTSMDDGPYWVILLMYESHDMRHTGFRRLTVVNGTLGFWGVTVLLTYSYHHAHTHIYLCVLFIYVSFLYSRASKVLSLRVR